MSFMEMSFENENVYYGFWDVTSWYLSHILRDLDEHSCDSILKLWISKSVFINNF